MNGEAPNSLAMPAAPIPQAAGIGALARRCLDLELETWPKPGLVSPADSGSHDDMDADLLRRSAVVLEPFFAALATAGRRGATMEELRRIRRRAEAAMLAETGDVNTHRGAIFGLGLLCAAAGRIDGSRRTGTLGTLVRTIWGEAIGAAPLSTRSHGAIAARAHNVSGARGEAAGGFRTLYDVGLPGLAEGRRLAPHDASPARVQAFFTLLASVADTNILLRGGAEGLAFARAAATDFLARGGVGADQWREAALDIHRAFVARRLSPGGCADLLAMTLFVEAWERHAAPGADP